MSQRLLPGSLVAAIALASLGAGAQPGKGPTAEQITGLVQAFYDQTKTLQADFQQTRYTRLYDRTDRAKGRVVFKKPGKMRWDYAKPNGQVFVTSGEKLLMYQPPEAGEKHGQLIERAINQDQLPQAFAFLIGSGRLADDFSIRLLEIDDKDFAGGYALQLLPRKASAHYEQIVFYVRVVEANGKKAGVIQRVLIIDAAGNRNRFDFKKLKFNRDVPDERFSYVPPKGTNVVKP